MNEVPVCSSRSCFGSRGVREIGSPQPSDIPQGSPFDAWRTRLWSLDEFWQQCTSGVGLRAQQLRYLAGLALLAPTSHNTVPERFALLPESGEIEICLDRQRVLVQSDAQGRQATISCGCVASYLDIVAGVYGLRAAHQMQAVALEAVRPYRPGAKRHPTLLRMSFERVAQPSRGREWLAAMLARKVLRAEYDPSASMDESIARGMQQIVDAYASVRLHVLTDAPTLLALGKFQELADHTVFNREEFARELGDWFLPNDTCSPVGMRGREYGLDDEAAMHFHRGLRGEERLLPDEVAALAKISNRGTRSASAVAVLTVDEDTVASRLVAGKALAELLLYLQIQGWATTMEAAITEVEAPNLALRGRLRTSRRPVVVFRVGKPKEARDTERAHAGRPSLDDVMLPEL